MEIETKTYEKPLKIIQDDLKDEIKRRNADIIKHENNSL